MMKLLIHRDDSEPALRLEVDRVRDQIRILEYDRPL